MPSYYAAALSRPVSHPLEDHFAGVKMIRQGYRGVLKDRSTRSAWKRGIRVGEEKKEGVGLMAWLINTTVDVAHLLLLFGGIYLLVQAML